MAHVDTKTWPLALAGVLALACAPACDQRDPSANRATGPLRINELMSDNDAAWIDEAGEVGDYIELVNVSSRSVELSRYALIGQGGAAFRMPAQVLPAGAHVVVFADDDASQGPLHAPWKLSARGETIHLFEHRSGTEIDRVEVPALGVNEVFARFPDGGGEFQRCRYASPERDNGQACEPPPPAELPEDSTWQPFEWPESWPSPPGPLVLSELALRPARFIEVQNIGAEPLPLRDYSVRLATTAPGRAWPTRDEGVALPWPEPEAQLAPGARVVIVLDAAATAQLEQDIAFEGVATVFDRDGVKVDRVDFMRWPSGATLARRPDRGGRLQFCREATPGEANQACDPLARRDAGDRLRHFYTPGDFDALARGDTNLGMSGVKFVVDLPAGDTVHLLSTQAWALHYQFVRERIELQPRLDRCDSGQNLEFQQGWYEFSDREYVAVESRRYLLGTLVRYAGSALQTLDFAVGDQVVGAQMKHAYFTVMRNLDAAPAADWWLHPTEPRQIPELRTIEGQAPIVGSNAPFRNQRFQPLTEGVAFGTLIFLPAAELERSALGPDVIVLTDAVPNDIPFVGGLITEAFQTPLAHVNVLSQNRGTPNMALRGARTDSSLAPLLDRLVRLEVRSGGFEVRAASADEVTAFLRDRRPDGPRIAPRLDPTLRGPVELNGRSLADLPSIGAKAAQLAELGRVVSSNPKCFGPIPVPAAGFAIPVAHYLDHFERSGARAQLEAARADARWDDDAALRERVLSQMRAKLLQTPVDPALLAAVEAMVRSRFGERRVRFRSSSNTEDLQGFNGAGLYQSLSGALNDPARPIADAIRTVWASLWSTRAYDEREFGRIDQSQVAMGVLVHEAFLSEAANVIAISRDVLDPVRTDIHYLNAQAGEASVANPAPGVTTEQLIHHWWPVPGTPTVEYQAKSSLTRGADVLSLAEIETVSCYLRAIHGHFLQLLDPTASNRWFAMDVEIKLTGGTAGAGRKVYFKQARPFSFSRSTRPTDCREL